MVGGAGGASSVDYVDALVEDVDVDCALGLRGG